MQDYAPDLRLSFFFKLNYIRIGVNLKLSALPSLSSLLC